jgi:hypothetical protein
VLAHPGEEYLVLQPDETVDSFTMSLVAGTYSIEWFNVNSREMVDASKVTIENSNSVSFSAPFEAASPVVLHLKKANA